MKSNVQNLNAQIEADLVQLRFHLVNVRNHVLTRQKSLVGEPGKAERLGTLITVDATLRAMREVILPELEKEFQHGP